MKIQSLTIKNFRSYQDETTVDFENLTALIGKNDSGKSTIMEALDVFFNDGKGLIKLDKDDINVDARESEDRDICIAIRFCDLPEKIIIDASCETTLEAEYLLNRYGQLEILKRYSNAGSAKVFIRAFHPTNPLCSNLLQQKDSELRKLITDRQITCPNMSINAVMRNSIWQYYGDDLQLDSVEIDVTKGDTKSIWDKLQKYLPLYSLFQSDRKNSDGDSEVQDPLKEAVKEILHDDSLQQTLNAVALTVETKLREVSNRTLEKLKEMSPDIASTLMPVIPSAASLKWADVFKNVSITSDANIPINKRGSGSKRLILLNFFRAEVERRLEESNAPSIIYAIEEPETSQHSDNQKKLIKALLSLAETDNTQVIITTHSATIVKQLELKNIRIVSREQTKKVIRTALPKLLHYDSLNEVNYIAFSEISEEYHDELYGHIERHNLLGEYKQGKQLIEYKRLKSRKNKEDELIIDKITRTEFIRHQIHHPENKYNKRFSDDDLYRSIEDMRAFLQKKHDQR